MMTPLDILEAIATKAKVRRLALKLTQAGLAKRSGVSLGSIKRFERTGKIAVESLLKIAMALACLEDFESVFDERKPEGIQTLDSLLKEEKTRKRGSIT